MNISDSSYITKLLAKVTFDISGTLPQVLIENMSEGPNLAGVDYWWSIYAPGDIPIYEGSQSSPDESGIWTEATNNSSWPRAFNNILFSGASYVFEFNCVDGDGNVYTTTQTASICRPPGNTKTSTNAYGLATALVEVKCADGRVFFQDTTNATYQGLTGELGASVLRVYYPPDQTGVIPEPFVGQHFSTALVPITYSSDSYQFQSYSIYDYDFGDEVHIRVRYQSFNPVNGSPAVRFAVLCNIDLCSLFCEVDKLVRSLETGNCANAQEAQQKLNLINPKLWMIVTGIQQPLCGIDVPALIEEVKLIGGFECDCCNAPTGIIPTNSSVIDGYNFEVVTECGDISGTVDKVGNNIQIILSDVTYTFAMCGNSPAETTAFNFSSELVGCNRQVCLNVDITQLSYDILNTIKSDGDLVNLFNSIVTSSGGGGDLLVDGKCIFSTADTCDYTFTLSGIPVNTTFALLTGIKVAASPAVVVLNYSFNLTNLPALQAYLNGLGYGTFTATNPSGQTVVITSVNNTAGITALKYSISSSNYLAGIGSECTGYSPLSASEVVQYIIDYICALDDSQVVTSEELELCYIDTNGNKQTETIAAGTTLTSFFQSLITRGCTTVDHIVSLGAVDCAGIKAVFPSTTNVMQANDYFLGTKENACSQILPTEAFLTMLQLGYNNNSIIDAFCKLLTRCNGGNICAPYDVFFAEVSAASPPDGTADLIVTFDHPDAVSNTIRYARIDNTVSPVYVTITEVLPGDSPYTISASPALANGQYRVGITAVYSDGRRCDEQFYDTLPCTGISAFNAVYDGSNINVTYTAESAVPYVKVNLSYPNGGSFSQIYANGDTITITPPAEVYGVFFATMQPVCDNDSGWFGAATAQVSFEIPQPYTVLIQVADPSGGSGNKITDILDLTGFTLPSEVTEGNYKGGYHQEFTGAIIVKLIQPAPLVINYVHLFVNEVEVDCEIVDNGSPFTKTFTFDSRDYVSTDIIKILYDNVVCDVSP